MNRFSFITSNIHKYTEMKGFFEAESLELDQIDKTLPEVQTHTLEEVVRHSLSTVEEKNVFVEDSGFFAESLKGFPGVYSRYVYDTIGNRGVLKLLKDELNRRASFKAVIGYKSPGGDIKLFKGEVKGYVSTSSRGRNGFGYDPIFIPAGHDVTFGEDIKLKSKISHRRKAAENLIQYLKIMRNE